MISSAQFSFKVSYLEAVYKDAIFLPLTIYTKTSNLKVEVGRYMNAGRPFDQRATTAGHRITDRQRPQNAKRESQ